MLTRPLGRPKNRWEGDIRNDMKKLKIKNWTSRISVNGNYVLRGPKHSKIEVVAPKEEEVLLRFTKRRNPASSPGFWET
jgi:hypothetical protein